MQKTAQDPDGSWIGVPSLADSVPRNSLTEEDRAGAALPAGTVHRLFEDVSLRQPDAVAVESAGKSLTYAELNRLANRLARRLRNIGVGPEVLVGLCVERSLDAIVGMLGILKAGGAYLPLDPAYPIERLRFMVEDSGASALVTHAAAEGRGAAIDAAGTLGLYRRGRAGRRKWERRRERRQRSRAAQPGIRHLHVRLDGQAERRRDRARVAGQPHSLGG